MKTERPHRILEVARQYPVYVHLLTALKEVISSPICLQSDRNHKSGLIATVVLRHPSITDELKMVITASRLHKRKCGFKIRAEFLSSVPCYRFDGDGPAHRNDFQDVALWERKVSTPHFHECRQDGWLFAFKTQYLQDERNEDALLDDINQALAHFCATANISDPSGIPPIPTIGNAQCLTPQSESDAMIGVE